MISTFQLMSERVDLHGLIHCLDKLFLCLLGPLLEEVGKGPRQSP